MRPEPGELALFVATLRRGGMWTTIHDGILREIRGMTSHEFDEFDACDALPPVPIDEIIREWCAAHPDEAREEYADMLERDAKAEEREA
jgi:hypothetical protein